MSPSSLVFLLLLVGAASASDNVLVLTDDNFNQAITDNEFILVKFYAPWCGHCKSLAPKYDEAADILHQEGSNIRLAKVDATENKAIAEKFEVRGFPTLIFFKNGYKSDYKGGRETQQIVDWLKKKTGPAVVTIDSIEKLGELKAAHGVLAVGNFKADSEEAKLFATLADAVEDAVFAESTVEDVLAAVQLETEGLALIRKDGDDSEVSVLAKKDFVSIEAAQKWIHGHKLALVNEFSQETASAIVGGDIKEFHFLLIGKTNVDFEKSLEEFRKAAADYRGRVVFVLLDTDLQENGRILEFLGVKPSDLPTNRIVNLDNNAQKYRPTGGDDYKTFTQKYLDGEIEVDYKKQDLPEDWDAQAVKVLVADNFNQIALDKTKNVFVKFYAPWCGHCKSLVPIWDELAEKYSSNPNVVIAKLDATENELPNLNIESFPTLKFFPAGSDKPISYSGERKLDDFVAFIDKQLDEQSTEGGEEETTHEEL